MFEAQQEYFRVIGFPNAAQERLAALCRTYAKFFSLADVRRVLLTNSGLTFHNANIITGSHLMEFKNFMTESNVDFIIFPRPVAYLQISRQSWDSGEPSEQSTINVSAIFDDDIKCDFIGMGANCKFVEITAIEELWPVLSVRGGAR